MSETFKHFVAGQVRPFFFFFFNRFFFSSFLSDPTAPLDACPHGHVLSHCQLVQAPRSWILGSHHRLFSLSDHLLFFFSDLQKKKPSWGVENRISSVRVIPDGKKGTRLETRIPGADSNAYLALAASLASGYYGVINKMFVFLSFDHLLFFFLWSTHKRSDTFFFRPKALSILTP